MEARQIPSNLSALWWRRFMARNGSLVDDLETFSTLSPRQQRRELARRLSAQIRYFGNRADALPEWKEAARISDENEVWKIWPSLPIVSKPMLGAKFHPREMQSRFSLEGVVKSTGGSTGEPTHFFHDYPMVRAGNAAAYFVQKKMGWSPGMLIIKIWGSERDIQRNNTCYNRINNLLLRLALIDGYHLNHVTVERVRQALPGRGPVAFHGFSSMLGFLAERFLEQEVQLPAGTVKVAWNAGEILLPQQVTSFQRAFGVPILNMYGGRESSTIACQFAFGEPLRVLRPWTFLEVVDAAGRPVSPGQPGRILFTSTVCRGTPFLRYDIGDVTSFDPTFLDESGIASMHEVVGRVAGLLQLPNGDIINNIFWNHLFKEYSEVKQFQIIIRKDGRLTIFLRSPDLQPNSEREISSKLHSFLQGVPFDLERVAEISPGPQGKRDQVVRER